MLQALFTSKTRIKILSLLLFNQDKDYHLREIARLTKSSPRHASLELGKLVRIGLVKRQDRGTLSIYGINKGSIILEELRNLFMKTEYFGELVRKTLNGKVRYVFIYGSFAKGEENIESDIDLFVIGGIGEDEILTLISKLERTTGREVNYTLWDDATFKERIGHPLIRSILASRIIMLVGDEDGFRRDVGGVTKR